MIRHDGLTKCIFFFVLLLLNLLYVMRNWTLLMCVTVHEVGFLRLDGWEA